jgi:hypothetical protein
MPRGSPAVKMAISIDRDVHAKVLSAVEAEHSTISARMTAAARQMLRAFDEEDAHRVGALLGRTKTQDIADGAVVALALERKADIRTEDAKDIRALVAAARAKVRVLQGREPL